MIKCIIVDDEPASREVLLKYTGDCPELELIQECKNAFEAGDVLQNHEVDLIFLDINMPKLSGIQFYKSLTKAPLVIFTTAYPEFAVEGFDLDAIDYLLKPFSFDRFLKAVNKVKDKKSSSLPDSNYIVLKADKKLYRINIVDISHLEAMGDYVKVFYNESHILVHDTFQNLLSNFTSSDIHRIHKSFAVSLSKIDCIEGNQVRIGDKSIPIGQSYRSEFLKLFEGK